MKTYEPHSFHFCIDDYQFPKDVEEWKNCPKCGLKPKIWEFDNGRSTACGCWESRYDQLGVSAESINSVINRTRGMREYDSEELKNNWNHFCETGEILFDKNKEYKETGRW